jgi:hypothetical protein
MPMQTPELLLSDLNLALRELRGAVVVLKDDDIIAKLLPIMRNLMLAEVLGNQWLIAVGGSQGAGKTNLVRTMYGLDAATQTDWLKDNEGRGERYPVLVQEDDVVKKPKGYLRKLIEVSGKYELDTLEAKDINEFHMACRGELPEVMLPVLKVPRKFFQQNGQALILLPGYETSNRDNQEWQALMRQVLIGAAGCLIVTDQTRLANQQQADILKDMLTNELRASRPLIVVSKTEGHANDPQRLNELRQSAVSVFKHKNDLLEPKVICTGSDNAEYIKQWMPELVAALQDMSIGGGELRQMQLARLEKLIESDLNSVTNLIHTRATQYLYQKNSGNVGVVADCLEAFDDAAKDLSTEYNQSVREMLSTQTSAAMDNLTPRLIGKHEGTWNKVKNVFDTVSETQRAIESDVTGAWSAPGHVLPRYAQLLNDLTAKKLKRVSGSKTLTLKSDHILQRLGYMDSKEQPVQSKLTDPGVHTNLAVLLRNTGDATTDLDKTARLLPVLALEYARVASLVPELVGVNAITLEPIPEINLLASAQKVQAEFGQFKDVSTNVIKGLGAMLAVDIAADGKVDTIPALLSALGFGGTVSTQPTSAPNGGPAIDGAVVGGTASTVALSVAAVVAIGFLAHSALRQVQHHDKEVKAMAENMLMKISDQHLTHFMSHFNDLMRDLRSHMHQSLRHRYALDQTLMEKDRLAKALADIHVLQRDILGELARSAQTLQLFGGKFA